MNFDKYDNVQATLGSIGDTLRSDLKEVLAVSEADEATKKTINDAILKVSYVIDELSHQISTVAQLMIDR